MFFVKSSQVPPCLNLIYSNFKSMMYLIKSPQSLKYNRQQPTGHLPRCAVNYCQHKQFISPSQLHDLRFPKRQEFWRADIYDSFYVQQRKYFNTDAFIE